MLCVDESGLILGFSGFYPASDNLHRLEFASLYVALEAQGHGVGGFLIRSMLRHARAREYQEVSIRVVNANTRASSIYRRYGAQPVASSLYSFGEVPVQCTDLIWNVT